MATTLVSRRRADQYARDGGVLPVDVMMKTMRALWDDATLDPTAKKSKDQRQRKERKPKEFDRKLMLEACGIAKDAAPYIHHRLATMEHTGKDGGSIEVLVKRAAASLQALSQAEFDTLLGLMQKIGMVSVSSGDPGSEAA